MLAMVLGVHSNLAIILLRKREMVALLFCFDSLCPSLQLFSHVGIRLPGLNQY